MCYEKIKKLYFNSRTAGSDGIRSCIYNGSGSGYGRRNSGSGGDCEY